MTYLDVEALLVAWIAARKGCRTCTELPADLAAEVPLVQVHRIAGSDLVLSLDQAIVDIDVFHTDKTAAHLLAEQIRTDMRLNLVGYRSGGGVVANVETVSGPIHLSYENTNVRRYTAAFRVTVHSAP